LVQQPSEIEGDEGLPAMAWVRKLSGVCHSQVRGLFRSKFVLAAILHSQMISAQIAARNSHFGIFLKEHSEKIYADEKFSTGYSDSGRAALVDG
jgi:hypothetical protein